MKEPIGVLHLVNQFTADGAVGQLVARLRAHPEGFRPVVACLQKAGPLLESLPAPVEEVRLAGSTAAAVVLKLAALMEREGVKLVHANDYYANLLGVPAAKLVRAKVVCSRLDLRHWAFGAQRFGEAMAMRAADAVMVNAAVLREKCVRQDRVPASKIHVVHNGVDMARFGKRTPPSALTVVTVANLHASKGHLDLIEAAARLREVKFLCAGEGPMRPVLEQQIAFHGLRERFLLLGHRIDVPALLAGASAYCAPSHEEGLPTSVVEAMAASLPVLATEVGGMVELVREGETGLLVPPRNPRALADRLSELLAEPARAGKLGTAARKRVEADFSLPALSKRLGELYRSVLANHDKSRAAA